MRSAATACSRHNNSLWLWVPAFAVDDTENVVNLRSYFPGILSSMPLT
ncbi:hypothetical protein ACVJGD_002965 [Bradyrhizobium sp. USDA 10063]